MADARRALQLGRHGKLIGFLDVGDDIGSLEQRARLDRAQAHRPVGPARSARRGDHVELDTAAQRMPLQVSTPSEPLRQAYASSSDADLDVATAVMPAPPAALAPTAPKPKVASHPQPQKNYAVLSDAQIAGIKERLKLTSDQEYYWPGIEHALHAIAHKIQAARLSNPNANAGSIDPDSEEVQQLKSAAMPLLFQLREDQKDEVRRLARVIGLEKVASAI